MIVRQDPHKYRTLRVYLFYRLVLAALLYLIFSLNIAKDQFGGFSPHLFQWSSLCYVLIALASLRLLRDKNAVNSTHKIATLLALDAIVLILLIHASGGLQSGLGYLLVITAAIASMFLHRQLALGFTALITLFLFAEAFYISSEGGDLTKSLFSAGTLGFLIFITSLTFLYLTERIKTSSQEAEKQTRYAKQLVQLAQHIVTRMRTGIVVIDEENRIELINESALQLLDLPSEEPYFGQDISLLSNLAEIILKWRTNPVSGLPQFHTLKAGHEIRINFASLTAQNSNKTILYLEDYRALMQQAQQLKLASLGRLTASIAHEVRNPLGAISHAAQLLSESDNIKDIDLRFTEIIVQHSARVNQIIENTLALSKRKEPKAELLELSEWIPEFIEEYSTAKTCKIHYINRGAHPQIKMDAAHLRQVLSNLFDNGLRYSLEQTGDASIDVVSARTVNDETNYIDIIDHGCGVPKDKLPHIFEPFFTTGEQGSGLGLYISRELCEINQANLHYKKTAAGKSCFRINFPHHQRMI